MSSKLTLEKVTEIYGQLINVLKQHEIEYADQAVGMFLVSAIKVGQVSMAPEEFIQMFMDLLGASAGIPQNQIPLYSAEQDSVINSKGGTDVN